MRNRGRWMRVVGFVALVGAAFASPSCGMGGGPCGLVQPLQITPTNAIGLQWFLNCDILTLNLPIGPSTTVPLTVPCYNGEFIGPTFRLSPGQILNLKIRNRFPSNPLGQRGGAFPHDPYTTNIHTHGLTVSAEGIADNVFRHMDPPTGGDFQEEYEVFIDIPEDHPSGTFWYHPHKHGSATYQFMGGMAGFLILEGGPGTLDTVPAVAAAQDLVLGFQTIRVDSDGETPWVNTGATNFQELWSPLGDGQLYVTTNGLLAPEVCLQPGEVVRFRMLNATVGETLALEIVPAEGRAPGIDMHLVAIDGLTLPQVMPLVQGESDPLIMGAGNRMDVMVKMPAEPGQYILRTLNTNPNGSNGPAVNASISPQGIAPGPRVARVFPNSMVGGTIPEFAFPVTLLHINVEGDPMDMALPVGALPVPEALDTAGVLAADPAARRAVSFDTGSSAPVPVGTSYPQYDAAYWGGTAFGSLLLMRDADDTGFTKEGLFEHGVPLFDDMFADTTEVWIVRNTSQSDHPFHIHQNPFLVTHINGNELPIPEWRDTILIPGRAVPNDPESEPGSVEFRTHFHPDFTGHWVMHCHILSHEDVGMMQVVEVKPGP